MALSLGIDTGGTYTDTVLFDDNSGIVSTAKSLTTRHDFSIGIGQSIDTVLKQSTLDPAEISLVSLSTTLATNALVEGQGGRVCVILIGFDNSTLARSGLSDAIGDDPVIFLDGGHDANGDEQTSLNIDSLNTHLENLDGEVSAFAVAGMFAVRNPDHEIRVRDKLVKLTDRPVTCSHELSAKLDGPRRALTCVLNARLINMIHHLVQATETLLKEHNIDAPLMVVQGDGALITASVAKLKPIETILSGPAASLVGASYLTGQNDAIVSDIGGTTTDIGILRNGAPRIDEDGATVGGWQTMVEAVAMHTFGLGGDSEVDSVQSGTSMTLKLGPRRLVPLSLLSVDHHDLVHRTLDRQLNQSRMHDLAGRFAIAVGRESAHLSALSDAERAVLDRLAPAPQPLDSFLENRRDHAALDRLVSRGLVMLSGLTPSDAAHVLNLHSAWDMEAARKGAVLFAKRKNASGLPFAPDAETIARWVIDTLVKKSAETILATSMSEDRFLMSVDAKKLLDGNNQAQQNALVSFNIGLGVPLIALGAPAATYYAEVADRLSTTALISGHAGVANALGAVVGNVRVSIEATITQPEQGMFRVFLESPPKNFPSFDAALTYATHELGQKCRQKAVEAGASDVEIKISHDDKIAIVDGQEMMIESLVKSTATGRPRISQ